MHSLIHQLLALTWSSNFENKMMHCKKIAPCNPNWVEFGHCKVFGVHKVRKGPEITSLTWKVGRSWDWKSLKMGNKRCKRRFPEQQTWWRVWQRGKGLLMVPVYKKSLCLGEMASIHPLCQIRTTYVNKENWGKNRLDGQTTSTCSKGTVSLTRSWKRLKVWTISGLWTLENYAWSLT